MGAGDFFRFWDRRILGWTFGRCREHSADRLIFDVWVTPRQSKRWTMPYATAAAEIAATLEACEVSP